MGPKARGVREVTRVYQENQVSRGNQVFLANQDLTAWTENQELWGPEGRKERWDYKDVVFRDPQALPGLVEADQEGIRSPVMTMVMRVG